MPTYRLRNFFLWTLILFSKLANAQCPGLGAGTHTLCDPLASSITLAHSGNIDFLFDTYYQINGGITRGGSTQIRIKAINNITDIFLLN